MNGKIFYEELQRFAITKTTYFVKIILLSKGRFVIDAYKRR